MLIHSITEQIGIKYKLGEADVVRGNIDVCSTSFSMYPDVGLPSVAAVSSLATSSPCLVTLFP